MIIGDTFPMRLGRYRVLLYYDICFSRVLLESYICVFFLEVLLLVLLLLFNTQMYVFQNSENKTAPARSTGLSPSWVPFVLAFILDL